MPGRSARRARLAGADRRLAGAGPAAGTGRSRAPAGAPAPEPVRGAVAGWPGRRPLEAGRRSAAGGWAAGGWAARRWAAGAGGWRLGGWRLGGWRLGGWRLGGGRGGLSVQLVRPAARRGDPEPGDPAPVHLGDGDPVVGDLHRRAHRGHLAEAGEHKAGRRLVGALGQVDPGLLGELVQVEQAFHLDLAAVQPPWLPLLDVVLVADVADQLLHQVFERDDAGRAAVLVDHDRQVGVLPAHLRQGGKDGLADRQELDVPGELGHGQRAVRPGGIEKVPDMNKTDHIVV